MKPWRDFLPVMMLQLPGCPEFVVEDAVRAAAIEFCDRTRVWKVEAVQLATTIAGQGLYYVTNNPTDAGLSHLHVAYAGEREIEVAGPGSSDDYFPGRADSRFRIQLAGRASIFLSPDPLEGGQALLDRVLEVFVADGS